MRSKCLQDEVNEKAPEALGAMALSVQSAGHFQGPALQNIANLESCKRNKCDSKLLERFKNQCSEFVEVDEAMRLDINCVLHHKSSETLLQNRL
jgi:hypothetical protein